MFRPFMAIISFFSFSLKVSLYKLRCEDLPSDYNRMGDLHIVIYIAKLYEGKKPDDGHIRPKHIVLIHTLEYTSFI